MKIFCVTLLVIAVLANSKVLGVTFECYECEGNSCFENLQLIVCSEDTVATPKPPQAPTIATSTASSSDITPTTVATTTTTSSDQTTPTTIAGSTTTVGSTTTPGSTTPATIGGSTTSQTIPVTATTIAQTTSLNPIVKDYHTISRRRRDTDTSFACYKLYYNTDNKSVMKMGCVENALNACDIAADSAQGPVESCTICKDTKCNSSAAIKSVTIASILLMFFPLFL